MTQITIPLPESLVLAIGVLLAFGLASALVVFAMMPAKAKPKEAIASFQSQMGLDRLPTAAFFLMVTSWGAIFLVLLIGILITIFKTIWWVTPEMLAGDSAAIWDWRFSIAKLTALTAVLGAVVALPFTIIRLKLNREQTKLMERQREIELDALLNDRFNSAVEDLYAQKQVSKWTGDQASNGWQDDFTRRIAGIDRLEVLVRERPEFAGRVAKMLCALVRTERESFPPLDWDNALSFDEQNDRFIECRVRVRSDLENAVQTIGRLKSIKGVDPSQVEINLSKANLQGMDLRELDFNGADLFATFAQGGDFECSDLREAYILCAEMQCSDLRGTKLQGACLKSAELQFADLAAAKFDAKTDLLDAVLDGAALQFVDLSIVPHIERALPKVFGDTSVTLPSNTKHAPEHWPKETLVFEDFRDQWRAFQRSIGQDPDNPE
ncbi:pentapeptide repeat-containing protein [Sulfitobacter mediterraneus]|uniref:Pentapeptide repeat protein n=1 Tax=Sulfitobacter mediterraneus TaxID=83219 RepID=A0A2T6CBH5_9RHOB|nr:pentapeptide repeat-containing protein [Sulfitobacter mediterraneus]KIN77053.1 Pentapeptide repeat protein [Sulfitobacter mediterraneus KCTC 32188]PTX72859.1 pentapeptide repeat protein [Sulfitobacter mediterraneus]